MLIASFDIGNFGFEDLLIWDFEDLLIKFIVNAQCNSVPELVAPS